MTFPVSQLCCMAASPAHRPQARAPSAVKFSLPPASGTATADSAGAASSVVSPLFHTGASPLKPQISSAEPQAALCSSPQKWPRKAPTRPQGPRTPPPVTHLPPRMPGDPFDEVDGAGGKQGSK
uniref:Uncharacterized protein n=1 Tax=Eimeria tenella TaxID=5802 RepID=H9B975_EIMTE|nr:hypothetical protein [Eimeria tenella]